LTDPLPTIDLDLDEDEHVTVRCSSPLLVEEGS
jgi:hypothetical protein